MSVIDEIKNKAKANKKTVVLPETTDMRTLTAAAEVISEGIADIILVRSSMLKVLHFFCFVICYAHSICKRTKDTLGVFT